MTTKLEDTFKDVLASLSTMLRQQPGAATFAVSRAQLDAVVGRILNDERRRTENHEKSEQNLQLMARISPHVLNFMAPILRSPRSLSIPTDHWLRYGGVSVTRAAAGGCIVAATNGKTIAIAYDAEATLTSPDGVHEMRFTVPDCIIMEPRGDGNIVKNILPIMTWVQDNMEPVGSIGMGADATGQMTECMARILEWTHFDACRVNKGQREHEQKPVSIGYGDLGWTFGVSAARENDPLKGRYLNYVHGSGRYVLIQSGFRTQKMPDTPKAGWFAAEVAASSEAQEA